MPESYQRMPESDPAIVFRLQGASYIGYFPLYTCWRISIIIETIQAWHDFIASRAPAKLAALLADDVVFHSPVVHKPQPGKALTMGYLLAAVAVLGNDSFRYQREIIGERHAALEFSTVIDGVEINGVDLIEWNESGQIVDFKVMVRPLKAINTLHTLMAEMLERMARPITTG